MRFLQADYIFPVSSPPVKNGVVITGDDGVIMDLVTGQNEMVAANRKAVEVYRGVIVPGFINAHCHLELSHLKNKLTPGKGLSGFIREITTNRNGSEPEIREAISKAEDEMIAEGIVAVGDISNNSSSFDQKKKGRLRYHTFIEVFDLAPERADKAFQDGLSLMKMLNESGAAGTSSIVPHAPYTVSARLLKLIHDYAQANDSLLSIHNQETESENEMFISGRGQLFETLSSFGDYYKSWKPTGADSLESSLLHFPRCNKMQLVHNTFTSADEITWAMLYSMMTWWCTCPNANLFIENNLPDYKIFIDAGCRMTVGTDSYASNYSLSILDELKTISVHAPYIKLQTLVRWATLNGAEFLGLQNQLGSIEKGKHPGLNLIKNIDSEKMELTSESEIEKLC
jgi:cytosine/adenosine deaminase-related metal-dependent hydrolase